MIAQIKIRKNFINKEGKAPLYLYVSLKRKVKMFGLKIYINPKYWDEKKARVKISHFEGDKLNLLLLNYQNKADTIIYEYTVNNRELNFDIFEREFFNIDVNKNKSFYDFIKSEIINLKGKLSDETLRYYKGDMTKLQKFKSDLSFADIDYKFLLDYENYMYKELNNKVNTVWKSMKFLKNFINKAILQNYMFDSPFKKYKLKTEPTNRTFLSIDEINQIEDARCKLSKPQTNVLNFFLFCCYTGLRYSDILNLTYSNINNDMLELKQHKTKQLIRIPLIDKAKFLINEPGKHLPVEKVFKVFSNQICNMYLKQVMKIAGINKTISFHCSRHTFATISLNLGIPLEVVSNLLGHQDLRTTKIYAKILDSYKIKEMNKWNK